MVKRLDEFNIGECGVVSKIIAEGKIKRRLLDMGVTPNTFLTLKKKAPLGDPIEVTLLNYELTLRKNEANLVLVEVQGDDLK